MNKLSEEYYRVDFETAKVLKEAGFDVPQIAHWYEYQQMELTPDFKYGVSYYNFNKELSTVSAPLISVALEWLYGKNCKFKQDNGSFWAFVHPITSESVAHKIVLPENYTEREFNLAFIKTCCNHLINK